MLPLRPYGTRLPLFFMHQLGGLSCCYAGLLQHIPPEYPIYGLQSRGMAERTVLPETLEELAADYVGEMRKMQPAGPLIGWSLGGSLLTRSRAGSRKRVKESPFWRCSMIPQGKRLEFPTMKEILEGLMRNS